MFSKKIICVGTKGRYSTLKEAFKRHRRGSLVIELVSDVLDEDDIMVPKTLKSLHIKSRDGLQRQFCTKHLSIYCNGVLSWFENLGSKDSTISIVGTERKVEDFFVSLKNCYIDYLIGVNNVGRVKQLFIEILDSEVATLVGFLNHDTSLNSVRMRFTIENTKIDVLQAFNFSDDTKIYTATSQDTKIHINDSYVNEINLRKQKEPQRQDGNFQLFITGDSVIVKGIH